MKSAPPPTSFPLLTSTNVGISRQNSLSFSFSPFATLVQHFKFVPSVSPKLLNLNQDHPTTKWFFGQILINELINCLIEILDLPIFGHMTKSAIEFESRDKVLLVTSLTDILTS